MLHSALWQELAKTVISVKSVRTPTQLAILSTLAALAMFRFAVAVAQEVDLSFYDSDSELFEQALNAAPINRISLFHIGLISEKVNGEYFVSQVLDGYPAHLAGIERGDKLLSIDGESFHHWRSFNDVESPDEIAARTIELIYQRDDVNIAVAVPVTFENLFDAYRTATANSIQEFAAGNKIIGYVHFWALSNSTHDLNFYHQVFKDLAHCDGVIIDLRNSSGFVSPSHLSAVYPTENYYLQTLASVNTELATPLYPLKAPKQWSANQQSEDFERDNYGKPIAVLQNTNTRNGAETLSQNLRELERVITIGEETASGSAAEIPSDFPLTRHSVNDPQYQAAVDALIGII